MNENPNTNESISNAEMIFESRPGGMESVENMLEYIDEEFADFSRIYEDILRSHEFTPEQNSSLTDNFESAKKETADVKEKILSLQ